MGRKPDTLQSMGFAELDVTERLNGTEHIAVACQKIKHTRKFTVNFCSTHGRGNQEEDKKKVFSF